ncbi:MAG: murein transglycosylase [Deltaproteobacteria bacterium SG8_13]|nr:MAG: murein transglycosylase [Deltaproteobacteria bacterium SG8_13]
MLACIVALSGGCAPEKDSRLEQIWNAGQITFITDNNAHCYFIYKDQPAGFEYELAKAFADYLLVDLQVRTPGWDDMFSHLLNGHGDVIAASLTRIPSREKRMAFSDAYLTIQQFIIIHKDNRGFFGPEDLHGKQVHVRSGTSYQQQLKELQKAGIDLQIALHKNVPTEELIRQVAEKEIGITVADTNVALLNRRYYPDTVMAFPISGRQSLGWAVREGDSELLEVINRFLANISEDGTFEKIYQTYYSRVELFDYVDLKTFHRRLDTRLPAYKSAIRSESRRHGFDWRLVAALIYQESHFDPAAVSYTGVQGLMQLTVATAREMGVTDRTDPRQSIRGGIKYLSTLYQRFEDIEDDAERMLFTLASYNVGYGHVRDAQQLAGEKGLDTKKWSSLRQTLPLLRYPKYYRRTRSGYARGTEPVRYVDRILTYYDVLRRRSLT